MIENGDFIFLDFTLLLTILTFLHSWETKTTHQIFELFQICLNFLRSELKAENIISGLLVYVVIRFSQG